MKEQFLIDLTESIIKYVEILESPNVCRIITKDLIFKHRDMSVEEVEAMVKQILEKK